MAGWRSELAGCRSSLSMSKIKVRISETKFRSFYKTLVTSLPLNTTAQNVIWKFIEFILYVDIQTVLKTLLTGRDAVWDWEDPLPFFLLPHLQITSQLLEAAINNQPWEMINYCLGPRSKLDFWNGWLQTTRDPF